jgi:hypothetical protein
MGALREVRARRRNAGVNDVVLMSYPMLHAAGLVAFAVGAEGQELRVCKITP